MWKKLWAFKGYALNAQGLIFAEVHRCEYYIRNDEDFLDFSAEYLAANKDKPYLNRRRFLPRIYLLVGL
jgi:hypothetical protein